MRQFQQQQFNAEGDLINKEKAMAPCGSFIPDYSIQMETEAQLERVLRSKRVGEDQPLKYLVEVNILKFGRKHKFPYRKIYLSEFFKLITIIARYSWRQWQTPRINGKKCRLIVGKCIIKSFGKISRGIFEGIW